MNIHAAAMALWFVMLAVTAFRVIINTLDSVASRVTANKECSAVYDECNCEVHKEAKDCIINTVVSLAFLLGMLTGLLRW